MRIATWNINSIRARLDTLLSWLRTTQPHVVLLQEIKTVKESFPTGPLEDLGYNCLVYGQKSYNGVAILSKFPIEDVQQGFPEPHPHHPPDARYLEAFTGGVRVASLYVPNGQTVGSEKYVYKLEFLQQLQEHFTTLRTYDEAIIIGGDYNIAPTDDDVYAPERWRDDVLCSPPERAAFRGLLHTGFTDSLRILYPASHPQGQGLYTWWDYRAGSWAKNAGLRIDHLLLSPQATDRLQAAGVDREVRAQPRPSDHAPVWCDLKDC